MTYIYRFAVVGSLLISTSVFGAVIHEGYSSEGYPGLNGAANASEDSPASEGIANGEGNDQVPKLCAVALEPDLGRGYTFEELEKQYLEDTMFPNSNPSPIFGAHNWAEGHGSEGYGSPEYDDEGYPVYQKGEGYSQHAGNKRSETANLHHSEIDMDWILENSSIFLKKYHWQTPEDRGGVFYDTLLSRRRMKAANEKNQHYTEIYGLRTVQDMMRMTTYLDKIPNKNFRLTTDHIKEAHALGGKHEKVLRQKLSSGPMSFLAGYLFQPGVYKKRRNQLSIMRGLPEPQYKNLLNKAEELKSYGVFKSMNGKNHADYLLRASIIKPPYKDENGIMRGWLLYPSHRIVEQAMQDIVDWANLHMARWRQGNGTLDPIKIATVVRQAMTYIHPFVNANGRIGYAVRDRILAAFDILSASTINKYHGIDLTVEQEYILTKYAIARQVYKLKANQSWSRAYTIESNFGLREAAIGDIPMDLRSNASPEFIQSLTTEGVNAEGYEFVPESSDIANTFSIGKKREKDFVLGFSGHFLDPMGVLYTTVPGSVETGRPKLVPLADANIPLLSMNGEYFKVDAWENPGHGRDMSPYHYANLRENIILARALKDGKLKGSDVELEDYAVIEKANGNGTYYFRKWDMNLVSFVSEIREDPNKDPLAVLMPFRGFIRGSEGGLQGVSGSSDFAKSLARGQESYEYVDIFGQAQRLDIYYRKLGRHIQKNHPEWENLILPKILESRRKIHTAARNLLGPVFPIFKSVFESTFEEQSLLKEKSSWLILRQDVGLIGFYNYIRRTAFWYRDFDTGINFFPEDRVMLARSSSSGKMEKLGMVSEGYLGELIRSNFPKLEMGIKNIFGELRRSAAEGSGAEFDYSKLKNIFEKKLAQIVLSSDRNKKLLQNFVTQSLENPYKSRGLEIEFEREFYLMYLHWQNSLPKFGVSLTTNPKLIYSNTHGSFADGTDEHGHGSSNYIVSMDIDKVRVAMASGYSNEYEVTGMEPEFNLLGSNGKLVQHKLRTKEKSYGGRKRISPKEAEEKGIDIDHADYLVFEGEVPEEIKSILRRFKYYPKGFPENIDKRSWSQPYGLETSFEGYAGGGAEGVVGQEGVGEYSPEGVGIHGNEGAVESPAAYDYYEGMPLEQFDSEED